MQVFGGSDNETFEMRSGTQSVDIAITTKDSRTESPVPWQDCLVIEGGGTFSIVDTEPEKGGQHGPFGHKEAQPLRFVGRVK